MRSAPGWSAGLNAAQLEAVRFGAGPVAVLAGPGTGKTRVITHRIARLIEEDGARPETIAAVTFTVKAAEEMRTRLAALIGDQAAKAVQAGTFHGFGRRLLKKWGDTINISASAELMDSAQRKRMLREAARQAIREGRIPGVVLAEGGLEALAERSWAWIEHLRTGAVFADQAPGLAERWGALIAAREQSGAWDEDRCSAERVRAQELAAASAVYAHFERLRTERGLLAFDDYILLPIRVLRESARARAWARDSVRHVVVDEFQDVNGAQLALLRELSPPELERDICVVGDDDQAIYGFRGSDDRAFQHFAEIWRGAARVTLTENYRSSAAVLIAAQRVIEAAHERFEPGKRVEARREFVEAVPQHVEAVEVEGSAEEASVIAAMVLEDLAQHPSRELSRVAVIARSHAAAGEIGRALELEGVAVDFSEMRRLEEDEAVLDVKAWIGLITGAPGLWGLRLLVRPPVGMEAERAVALAEAHAAAVRSAEAEGSQAPGFAVFLAERAGESAALARFAELTELAARLPAHEAAAEIIARTGVAHREFAGRREDARRIRALAEFLGFVRTLQGRIDAPGDLAAYQRYSDELDESEQRGGLAGFEKRERENEAELGGAGVKLLTAHGSKGLEFDTVYVPRIGALKGNFGAAQEREGPALPAELLEFEPDARSGLERERDEERRLFYVACTRAERRLVLLSKRAKSRSTSMHLFQELAWRGKAPMLETDADGPVRLVQGPEVIRRAAAAGVELRGGDALSAEAAPREARPRILADARRTARRAAGAALDRAEDGVSSEGELDSITDELIEAARRLAVVRAVETGGAESVPGWLGGASGYAGELADRLALAMSAGAAAVRPGLAGPLELSYSKVDQYHRCPGCFFLRYVLGLSEAWTGQQIVGTVAHTALERFYRAWGDADAEGRARPGLEELLAIARETFEAESRRVRGVEREQLDQVLAQLTLGYERLHDEEAEILMLEEQSRFAYARAGAAEAAHSFVAQLDRVDRVGDEFRIVDYKTGRALGKLAEPRKDDLQLGIYAMALASKLEMEASELVGTAEYWLFSTGQRGVLRLEEIDYAKVRKVIDGAITGMLAGQFAPKKGCEGECGLLLGGE